MGDTGDQRDYEPVRDRLELLFQPPYVPAVRQAKGWERENATTDTGNEDEKIPGGFVPVPEQMELPF